MNEISEAIKTKQTQITQLQSDIDTLQSAASILGEKKTAKATSQPKTKRKIKRKRRKVSAWAKGSPAQPKQRKRKPWSAAAKRAMSKRVKASWAKRRKAKGVGMGEWPLSVYGVLQDLFGARRHLLRAVHHRSLRTHSFRVSDEVTCVC